MSKKKYSQVQATLALTKASLKSMLKNPSSLFFGILFPLVFIVVFAVIGGGGVSASLYLMDDIHIDNPVYEIIQESETINIKEYDSLEEAEYDLELGRVGGILNITEETSEFGVPSYEIDLTTSEAAPQEGGLLFSLLKGVSDSINLEIQAIENPFIILETEEVSGRKYTQIDFILPGQLGFGLLSSGVFGTAFLLLDLKKTLVLKRFYATPINRINILVAEGLSKLVYSMLQAVVIVSVGYFAFDFTLINGIWTFLAMLLLSALGLIVFLGLGLFVSAVSTSMESVSPIANLMTLPQFLLAGTFFPTDMFPEWLQPFSNALPLKHLNDAMRLVAFEGASLVDVLPQIGSLMLWAVIVYMLTARFFTWEE